MKFLNRHTKVFLCAGIILLVFVGGLSLAGINGPLRSVVDQLDQHTLSFIGPRLRARIIATFASIRMGWLRKPFIASGQIGNLQPRLEPGDIILTRDGLKLSTIIIPGFWTHAALYIGSPSEFEAYFSGMPVPDIWRSVIGRNGAGGKALSQENNHLGFIIEAVIEGVGIHALEDLVPTDYLAVLRPQLTKQAKLAALTRAVSMDGSAYDFYFDFDTEDALICSELVYRAYAGKPDSQKLNFPLYLRNERRFMTVNDIVKQYSRALESGAQQLNCILFIDGRNSLGHQPLDTVSAFRDSWLRKRP